MSQNWRVSFFDESKNQICAMYSDGSGSSCLTLDSNIFPDSYPTKGFLTWSPDGRRLAFPTECNLHLWEVGKDVNSLLNGQTCGIFREPEWSPDGNFITYLSEELQRTCQDCQAVFSDVFIDSLDGTIHHSVTSDFNGPSYSPSWSPNSRRIAFAFSARSQDSQNNFITHNEEIFVYSLDLNQAINLTQDPSRDVDPVWSPDGRFIAFLSDRSGSFDLYSMHPDGSGIKKVAQLGVDYYWPYSSYLLTWLPDGKRILYNNQLIYNETGNVTILNFAFETLYASWFTRSELQVPSPFPSPTVSPAGSSLQQVFPLLACLP